MNDLHNFLPKITPKFKQQRSQAVPVMTFVGPTNMLVYDGLQNADQRYIAPVYYTSPIYTSQVYYAPQSTLRVDAGRKQRSFNQPKL